MSRPEIGGDFIEPSVRFEKGDDHCAIGTNFSCQIGELFHVADMTTLHEVGPEQPFLDFTLLDQHVGLVGPPNQSVSEKGVGAQRLIHMEFETVGCSFDGNPVNDRLSLLRTAELLGVGVEHGAGRAGSRCRIELEWSVRDLDIDAQVATGGADRLLETRLEPSFTDVAPRAHHVGPHVNWDDRTFTGSFDSLDVHESTVGPYRQFVMAETSRESRELSHAAEPDVQATFCATLVDQWIERGVCQAVIAPGSRSTPLALAIADRDELVVHVVHDERSAAFVALGAAVDSGVPALLVCTSGTAAANFLPAVAEANLSQVPMLVLTSDRPAELRGVGAPQTIDQTELFGSHAVWFHDPDVAVATTSHTWRPLADEAFDRSTAGPVQLNLPFREPLIGRQLPMPELVDDEVVRRWQPSEPEYDLVPADFDQQRGVILVGGRSGVPQADVTALHGFTEWPIIADSQSGLRDHPGAVVTADALLRHQQFADDHVPTVIVRIGRPAASKLLAQWSVRSAATLIQVGGPGRIDPDHNVAAVCSIRSLLEAEPTGATGTTWLRRWRRADALADEAIERELAEGELCEATVARTIADHLPERARLTVSSSMPIRDLEWFGGRTAKAHANRGANGIDGVLSTSLGRTLAAHDDARPGVVLIGDVAYLHDSNALVGLSQRSVDLRIVVVDNDGGGIFSFLPQSAELDPKRFEQLFGTPHGADLVAIAKACGVPATTVTSRDELVKHLGQPGPWVVRIASDRRANVHDHRRLDEAVRRALDN